tara:strand:+ start:153 stop:455 length:303 start_codon:yes stop_codon:yes gene_type:complete
VNKINNKEFSMKHTQGKWSVHNFECADRNGGCFIKDNDGEDLAKVYGDREEDLANANLIASAPEMLEALYNAQDALYRSGGDQKDIQAIWAVINNAEGGE